MKQKKKKSDELITKGYLEKSFLNFAQAIRNEIRFGFEQMYEKLQERITKHTGLILTTVGPLLKELETRQQDRELAAEHSRRI